MDRPVTSTTILGSCAVLVVLAIPGFAQTNTSGELLALRSTSSVARVYVASRSATPDDVRLSPNVTVTSLYQPTIDLMLSKSPTFRRQVARIAAATNLMITIEALPSRAAHPPARTTIVRGLSGRLEATMSVAAVGRTAELIAHEFEHVIEQLDGINLRHLSELRASGVRHCDCAGFNAFETSRAIDAGRRVAREVGERAE
jgi:hypothetical protein